MFHLSSMRMICNSSPLSVAGWLVSANRGILLLVLCYVPVWLSPTIRQAFSIPGHLHHLLCGALAVPRCCPEPRSRFYKRELSHPRSYGTKSAGSYLESLQLLHSLIYFTQQPYLVPTWNPVFCICHLQANSCDFLECFNCACTWFLLIDNCLSLIIFFCDCFFL